MANYYVNGVNKGEYAGGRTRTDMGVKPARF